MGRGSLVKRPVACLHSRGAREGGRETAVRERGFRTSCAKKDPSSKICQRVLEEFRRVLEEF